MARIATVAAVRQTSPGVTEIAVADLFAAVQAERGADGSSAVHEYELHVAPPNAKQ